MAAGLVELNLGYNKLTNLPLQALQGLADLRKVVLTGNPIAADSVSLEVIRHALPRAVVV